MMNKEMMKEIIKNRTQVAIESIYDEVIRDLLTVVFLRMNLLITMKKSIRAALKKLRYLEHSNMK